MNIYIYIYYSGGEVNSFRQIITFLKETSQKSREELDDECKQKKDGKQRENVEKFKVAFNSDILSQNTVVVLKEKCRELGLNLSGNKTTLIERLKRSLIQQQLPIHKALSINEFMEEEKISQVQFEEVSTQLNSSSYFLNTAPNL